MLSGKFYVMNIGLDLRLVDTRTLEVVDVISYQKQIIGREVSAGIFDILGGNIFDINAGEGALEPIQLAVRSVVERALLEMMANLERERNAGLTAQIALLQRKAELEAQKVTAEGGTDADAAAARTIRRGPRAA